MNVRITKCEVYTGGNMVNGQHHGSKWQNRWEVTVCFDSKEEAEAFAKKTTSAQDEIVFTGE